MVQLMAVRFTQWLTLAQGQRRIDMQVKIDWKGNPGIGGIYSPWRFQNYRSTQSFL